jgi:tetratricopeptide (TPR) repeat protein/predicted Ser/Thr protein kinase
VPVQPTHVVPTTQADATPEVIGKYELREELGRGGMGIVYRAYDRVLKRSVALKMINDPKRAGGKLLKRFTQEASIIARLHDPRLVPIFEVGEYEKKPYFVMELIEGRSLQRLLREETVPGRRVAEIVREVALALKHAHENGIIHRDVKPENILIDSSGNPRLMDFGLAIDEETEERFTAPGAILGTPEYMSPEQAAGATSELTEATDIYALGAILYHALVGKPPFQATEMHRVIYKVITLEPTPPRRLDPKIHQDLETITLRCLMKEPTRRYLTAEEVADELGRYLAGEPIVARPQGSIERAWRRARRYRGFVIAFLLLLILVGMGGAFLDDMRRRDNAKALEELRAEKERAARAAAQAESEKARATIEEARTALAGNEFQRALDAANRAVELDPKSADAWAVRATARFRTTDRQGALDDAARAIELDPRCSLAWITRASVESNKHETEAAIADANRALEIDPKDGRAYHVRGCARFNAGDVEGALGDATKAIELKPKEAGAWLLRASARLNTREYDGAIEDATRGIELEPTDAHGWQARGAARAMRAKKGDLESAVEDLSRAIAMLPGEAEFWMLRAIAKARLGEDEGVIQDCTKALELDPRNAQTWTVRAHSRLNLKDLEGARSDFRRFLELDPKGPSSDEAREQLGKLEKQP